MNDNQKIGKNLKMLRKIHHETLEELGDILGLSKSAVSFYEKGERALDTQKLQLYANHYGKTVDELVNGDLTSLNSMGAFCGNKEQMKIILDVMYPMVSSEKANQNKNFAIAYEKHTKILESLYEMETPSKILVNQCWETYTSVLEEAEMVESAINLLAILFICWASIADEQQVENGKRIKNSGKKPIESKKLLSSAYVEINPEIIKKREDFLDEYDEMVMSLIALVKSKIEWAEYGDYYFALKYVVGMQDNSLSLELNREIGIQMICSLVEIYNQQAANFLVETDKTMK